MRQYVRTLFLLVMCTTPFFPGNFRYDRAFAQDEPPPAAKSEDLLKEVDHLYSTQRSSSEVVGKIGELLKEAVRLEGETYETTWRMARLQWWKADGALGNETLMEKEAKEGWDCAKKAVALNPNRVEGHFWLAANIGQYSLAVGVLRALSNGLENKFLEPLEKSIKMDPNYEDAAPIRTKGTYYLNLPWPMRDVPKAIELLTKAIQMKPRGIRNRWYLAQAYEKGDDIPAAIAELDKILAASPQSVDPGDLPRLQGWAKKMKARLQDAK